MESYFEKNKRVEIFNKFYAFIEIFENRNFLKTYKNGTPFSMQEVKQHFGIMTRMVYHSDYKLDDYWSNSL